MIENIPVVGSLCECPKCNRKVLVEQALIGINHCIGIFVVCWECLSEEKRKEISQKYKIGDQNVQS